MDDSRIVELYWRRSGDQGQLSPAPLLCPVRPKAVEGQPPGDLPKEGRQILGAVVRYGVPRPQPGANH